MSWDIIVMDLPVSANAILDIPNDFKPAPVGRRSEIIKAIESLVPSADFSDPAWGIIDGPGFSVEVGMGNAELVDSFAFHVRGGDAAAGLVAEVLRVLGLRALDTTLGDFFRPESAVESLRKWRAYRDYVVSTGSAI